MDALSGILAIVGPIIESLGLNVSWIVTMVFIIGSIRVVMKPLMSAISAFVKITPSQKDDVILEKVMNSKAYKVVAYILDWFVSLKLPNKKEKK